LGLPDLAKEASGSERHFVYLQMPGLLLNVYTAPPKSRKLAARYDPEQFADMGRKW